MAKSHKNKRTSERFQRVYKKHDRRNRRQKNNNKNKNRNKNKEDFIPGIGDVGGGMSDFFTDIGDFFKHDIPQFFRALGSIFLWIFYVIWWFISDVLNPAVWIMDVIMGAFVGLQLFVMAILDMCMSFMRKTFNLFLGPLAKGIWGDEFDDRRTSKCYKTPDCTVPYPVLIATVILPPLGVFMELGLKGWLNILICAGLTLLYYLPGLIYALILLYC